MPTTNTIEVYTFDELSDEVKEKVRERWRDGSLDYEWWDSLYDDFEHVAECLGVEFDHRGGKNWKGEPICGQPSIYFSGFHSQGDGACFEGSWSFKKGWRKALSEYAPKDKELLRIGLELSCCARQTFYRCSARVKHVGHYYHEHSVGIDVYVNDSLGFEIAIPQNVEDGVSEALRNFMRWMYRSLEREAEYLMSDEAVDEDIRSNWTELNKEGGLL
jgi:hypothetical protein